MSRSTKQEVVISAPNIKTAVFQITGTAPLVIHRFSHKAKQEMAQKMKDGSQAKKGKKRDPKDFDEAYNEARYIAPDGWDGFNASSIRAALISACRLCGFKMTIAKLSVFVTPDGWDEKEPEIPLVRIEGKPRKLESTARVETGQAYITIRACYDKWSAKLNIRYDADMFTVTDLANLLMRAGEQVGIGEGRPDSKKSAGMGWGTFTVKGK